jgi:hypothetical protein
MRWTLRTTSEFRADSFTPMPRFMPGHLAFVTPSHAWISSRVGSGGRHAGFAPRHADATGAVLSLSTGWGASVPGIRLAGAERALQSVTEACLTHRPALRGRGRPVGAAGGSIKGGTSPSHADGLRALPVASQPAGGLNLGLQSEKSGQKSPARPVPEPPPAGSLRISCEIRNFLFFSRNRFQIPDKFQLNPAFSPGYDFQYRDSRESVICRPLEIPFPAVISRDNKLPARECERSPV